MTTVARPLIKADIKKLLIFSMGLTEENVAAVQKSWDIAKSVAKLRQLEQ
jgi:hypothetical protein